MFDVGEYGWVSAICIGVANGALMAAVMAHRTVVDDVKIRSRAKGHEEGVTAAFVTNNRLECLVVQEVRLLRETGRLLPGALEMANASLGERGEAGHCTLRHCPHCEKNATLILDFITRAAGDP